MSVKSENKIKMTVLSKQMEYLLFINDEIIWYSHYYNMWFPV